VGVPFLSGPAWQGALGGISDSEDLERAAPPLAALKTSRHPPQPPRGAGKMAVGRRCLPSFAGLCWLWQPLKGSTRLFRSSPPSPPFLALALATSISRASSASCSGAGSSWWVCWRSGLLSRTPQWLWVHPGRAPAVAAPLPGVPGAAAGTPREPSSSRGRSPRDGRGYARERFAPHDGDVLQPGRLRQAGGESCQLRARRYGHLLKAPHVCKSFGDSRRLGRLPSCRETRLVRPAVVSGRE